MFTRQNLQGRTKKLNIIHINTAEEEDHISESEKRVITKQTATVRDVSLRLNFINYN